MKIDIWHPQIMGMEKFEPTVHKCVFVNPKLDRVCVLLNYDQAIVFLFKSGFISDWRGKPITKHRFTLRHAIRNKYRYFYLRIMVRLG